VLQDNLPSAVPATPGWAITTPNSVKTSATREAYRGIRADPFRFCVRPIPSGRGALAFQGDSHDDQYAHAKFHNAA
jgi:hypothetical protein